MTSKAILVICLLAFVLSTVHSARRSKSESRNLLKSHTEVRANMDWKSMQSEVSVSNQGGAKKDGDKEEAAGVTKLGFLYVMFSFSITFGPLVIIAVIVYLCASETLPKSL